MASFLIAKLFPPRRLVGSLGLVLLLMVWVAGCDMDIDYRPQATGPKEQITVVTDSTHWNGAIGDGIRDNITPHITTLPQPERAFETEHAQLVSDRILDNVKTRRNVVFIEPLNANTPTAEFLREELSEDVHEAVRDGETVIVPREDFWRQDQRAYLITANTEEQLVEALDEHGPRIQTTFHEATLDRMHLDMFEKGRQPELEDSLMESHDFAVNMQHDYRVAADTTNFVWLRRVLPDTRREMWIHYIDDADPGKISTDWINAQRDSLNQRYLRGTLDGFKQTDYRRPLDANETNFLGRFGYETRGLWYMVGETEDGSLVQHGSGGPFVNYTFYDRATDRIYMIEGMVFAPDYGKRDFLRQMEVIAHSFRTAEEVRDDADDEESLAQRDP